MNAQQPPSDAIRRLGHLKQSLHFIWQSGPIWIVIVLLLFIIQGVLPLLMLYLLKLIVDSAAATGLAAGDKTAFGEVVFLIALAGMVSLSSAFFRNISQLVNQAQTLKIANRVYYRLHAKTLEVDLACYENAQYYDKLHRAQKEAPHRTYRIIHDL
ncbi:hypothetical protein [Candidatus Electrothrix sp.]|uniref:hypothetical protein n=1 Tax=Candidatus Electrothrix sp. TaxID=2170559 RepID=UPI004055B361